MRPLHALSPQEVGDIDGGGEINTLDLLAILAVWGKCDPLPAECPGDLDAPGLVGFADLLIVLQNRD